jgi:heptosyltransferase-2
MSLPLVGMLGSGDASLAVVAPPATARVYWGIDGVDELVVLPKKTATRGVAPRYDYLRKIRPDAVVLLPPSFSSALAPWAARIGVRAGYATDGRAALLTDALVADRERHLSESFLRLGDSALGRLELDVPETFDTPGVRVADADAAALQQALKSVGVSGRYAVVVPGATYGPAKSWPWRRYRDVARELARDTAVVVAGTATEGEMCALIAAGAENVFDVAGQTPLGVFLALLSRASVVVANDSGSPHLTASLGTPVVVLFGSTSPEWTAPLGPVVDVVRHPVHCSPCFRKTCPTRLECFDGITVDEVLRRTRSAAGIKTQPDVEL